MMEYLPYEILYKIIMYLPREDAINFININGRIRSIGENDSLWLKLSCRDYHNELGNKDEFNNSEYNRTNLQWKKSYFQTKWLPITFKEHKISSIKVNCHDKLRNIYEDIVSNLRMFYDRNTIITFMKKSKLLLAFKRIKAPRRWGLNYPDITLDGSIGAIRHYNKSVWRNTTHIEIFNLDKNSKYYNPNYRFGGYKCPTCKNDDINGTIISLPRKNKIYCSCCVCGTLYHMRILNNMTIVSDA